MPAQTPVDSVIGKRVRLITLAPARENASVIIGDVISSSRDTILLKLSGTRSSASILRDDIRAAAFADEATRRNGAVAGFKDGLYTTVLVLPLVLLGHALAHERRIDFPSAGQIGTSLGSYVVVSTSVGFVRRTTRWRKLKID